MGQQEESRAVGSGQCGGGRLGNGPRGCRRQVLAAVKHSARSTWTAAAVGGEGAVVQAGEEPEATMAHYGKLSRCA